MKKISLVIIGVILGASTVFAVHGSFADSDRFEDWYRDAVLSMHNIGVMNGYDDGSFRPGNAVNRAELAVMLQKYDKHSIAQFDDLLSGKLLRFMKAQEKFEDSNVGSAYKHMIILAEAGFRKVAGVPTNLNQYTQRTDIENLPAGYTIYVSPGIRYSFYIHYEGERANDDALYQADEWYGPF